MQYSKELQPIGLESAPLAAILLLYVVFVTPSSKNLEYVQK